MSEGWRARCRSFRAMQKLALLGSLVLVVSLPGCSDDEGAKPNGSSPSATDPAKLDGPSTTGPGGTEAGPGAGATGTNPPGDAEEDTVPPAIDPSPETHPEVVHVLARGFSGEGFCTGTLIASDVVLTAGHCLQAMFNAWSIVAPSAPNSPRVRATNALVYDQRWKDPGHPDLGILKLARSVSLPTYGELTDITARVDAKKLTLVAGVVRTEEEPDAAFRKTDALEVSSTVDIGYTHGFGVPRFSAGGDSGAGLFLIQKGQMTHKVVGVEREPEPSREIDHLSRIDAAFIAWVADKTR